LRREIEPSSLGFPGIDLLLEGECLHCMSPVFQ
jgi:hypothetical protein